MRTGFIAVVGAWGILFSGPAHAGRGVLDILRCELPRDVNLGAFVEALEKEGIRYEDFFRSPVGGGLGEKTARRLGPLQRLMASEIDLALATCGLTESVGDIPRNELLGRPKDALEFRSIGGGLYRVKSFVTRSPAYGRIRFEVKGDKLYRARILDEGVRYYLHLRGPFAADPIVPTPDGLVTLVTQ